MKVVSDATPIISLAKLNLLGLLRILFGNVLLSRAVFDEVCSNPKYEAEASIVRKSNITKIIVVENRQSVENLREAGLGIGESEAIVLADSLPNSLLLMDERKGRLIASSMNIKIIGTLGLLLHAKKMGHVQNIKPLLDMLMRENIRISKNLYDAMLAYAEE